jgi:hypothetical protein
MLYLSDLKSPVLSQLIELERDCRETAERQIVNLVDEAYFPGSVVNSSTDVIDGYVRDILQLATNIECDVREWGKAAKAVIKTRAKAEKGMRKKAA